MAAVVIPAFLFLVLGCGTGGKSKRWEDAGVGHKTLAEGDVKVSARYLNMTALRMRISSSVSRSPAIGPFLKRLESLVRKEDLGADDRAPHRGSGESRYFFSGPSVLT
jgi:hypothetical protein